MQTHVEYRKMLKRNHILDLIRHSTEPISRSDVKKTTGYSMTTVSNVISDLVREGLLWEDACTDEARMGRKPVFLHINGDGGYFIGIEFNIEALHYVVLDFSCRLVYSGGVQLPENVSTPALLELIFAKTRECLDQLAGKRVLGIGLGLPGYIDSAAGVALRYPYLADWVNVPVMRLMKEKFGLPCYIGNNVGVMGLVFKWINEYHEDNDFLLVSIRSGVRCIPVLGQQPYFGRISSSGEIGHLRVRQGGRVCDCGHRGCLNTEVTDQSLAAIMEEGFGQGQYAAVQKLSGGGRPTVAQLVRSALAGDAESAALVRRAGTYMGPAVAAAGNLYAPQKVIVSGQLTLAGPLFFEPLRAQAKEECLPAVMEHMEIISSPFGDTIGALGAAALPLENAFNPLVTNRDL